MIVFMKKLAKITGIGKTTGIGNLRNRKASASQKCTCLLQTVLRYILHRRNSEIFLKQHRTFGLTTVSNSGNIPEQDFILIIFLHKSNH